MPLGIVVTLLVVGVTTLTGAVGYLVDKSEENQELKGVTRVPDRDSGKSEDNTP